MEYALAYPTLQAASEWYVLGARRSPLGMGCGVLATAMVRARVTIERARRSLSVMGVFSVA
jgi:hypothetical protein